MILSWEQFLKGTESSQKVEEFLGDRLPNSESSCFIGEGGHEYGKKSAGPGDETWS
jgi:hypothetical protein